MMNRFRVVCAITAGIILAGSPVARSETVNTPARFVTSIAAVFHGKTGAGIQGKTKTAHHANATSRARRRSPSMAQTLRRHRKAAPSTNKQQTVANHTYWWV